MDDASSRLREGVARLAAGWIEQTTIRMVDAWDRLGPEARAAAEACGLSGFWMGYFAFRAAPLGAAGPEVVTEAFFNFAPRMVARAIPDAWERATPEDLVRARRASAAAALRRLAPSVDDIDAAAVIALIDAVYVPTIAVSGLPLFAANRALASPTDLVEMVWQLCTSLREHRGDAHVAALRAAGLDGPESHLLFAADRGVPEALLRDNRGWSAMEWEMARAALLNRGLVALSGAITPEGRALRVSVEAATDARAAAVFDGVDAAAILHELEPVARAVAASELIPFPNPIGLPRLT